MSPGHVKLDAVTSRANTQTLSAVYKIPTDKNSFKSLIGRTIVITITLSGNPSK